MRPAGLRDFDHFALLTLADLLAFTDRDSAGNARRHTSFGFVYVHRCARYRFDGYDIPSAGAHGADECLLLTYIPVQSRCAVRDYGVKLAAFERCHHRAILRPGLSARRAYVIVRIDGRDVPSTKLAELDAVLPLSLDA